MIQKFMYFYEKGTDLKTEHLMGCFMRIFPTFMHDSTFEWKNKTTNNVNNKSVRKGLKISGTSFSAN